MPVAREFTLAGGEASSDPMPTGAIDTLLKGAASQAIQNLNVQLGFGETEGLS